MRNAFDKVCDGFLIGMGISLFLFTKHSVCKFLGFKCDHYTPSDF